MVDIEVLDLFAGPGGWSLAARVLGLDELGVEADEAVCRTRSAAGLATLRADVSRLDPSEFSCRGLVASPPCQPFSAAGAGISSRELDDLLVAIGRDEAIGPLSDPRAALVAAPLYWALALRPEWVALEQVPSVQPIWQTIAWTLERAGYSTAVGVLSAEQFGVPQTRRRAFMVASRVREVHLPAPTHNAYGARRDPDLKGWLAMVDVLPVSPELVFCPTNLRPQAHYRPATAPAPTLAFGRDRPRWVTPWELAVYRTTGQQAGVKVPLADVGVLQSFPVDYPWQGGALARGRQIGDAVPPPLAQAVLRSAMGLLEG